MRIKLSYKLFGAFFLILAIVLLSMGLSQYFFSLNFKNYIHQVELEKLEELVPILKKEYLVHGNWDDIKTNNKKWQRLLRDKMDAIIHFPPPEDIPPPNESEPPEQRPNFSESDFPENRPHHDNPGPPPGRHKEIFLVDYNYLPIIGKFEPDEEKQMVPINLEGKLIGWIGLQKRSPFKTGPPAMLLKRQTRHLYILSSIVIGLMCLIAFLLSRHLLRPIRRLTNGTKELADRNFSVRISATTRDELGQLSENFNMMAQTLENYESTRQQWLTDISHELRTPLAVLQGEIEALQDGVRKPTADNLASLHAEILRIIKLVEDLHMTSIADSEPLYLKKERIYPFAILESIIESYYARLGSREITLKTAFGNFYDVSLMGDGDRLGQVFTNILENACKYVESSGTLSISCTRDERYLILYFQDTGPGVPESALSRLFDRLYRVETSRSRQSGGSGLGLSICRHIIEHHGGKIWAEKSGLGGLLIGVRLPLNG